MLKLLRSAGDHINIAALVVQNLVALIYKLGMLSWKRTLTKVVRLSQ